VSGRLQVSLVLFALPLCAAESLVTGRVADENNTAVAEARVALTSGAVTFRATTNPTGDFHLQLPEGHYTAIAEHDGYFPLRGRTVDLSAGPQELNIVLNHVREVFQSVKVEGSPQPIDLDQTDNRQKLTGLNVLNTPYPSTHDIRNAMKLMPGVVQDTQGGLHFSGSAENQVLYTLDGFNVGDPMDGGFATRLNVDMVRSLEYSSGRYSPEFGKGSAGVLAIQTEMGDDTLRYDATNFVPGVDTRSGLHIGTFAPRFGLFGPIVKGRAWFSESVEGEYSTLVVAGLPANEQRTTSYRAGDLLRTQVNLTPANILFASFLANAWTAPETGLGVLDPPETTLGQRSRTWFYSLKDQIYLPHGVLVELGFGEDRVFGRRIPQGHDFYEITPFGHRGNAFTDLTQTSRRDQFLANLFLPAFHLGGRHQVKIGSDLDRLHFTQRAVRTGYEIFGIQGELLQRTTFGGSGLLSRPSLEMSTYLLDAWRIRPNLTADIGLRQDWDELVRRTVYSPRLAIAWSPFGSQNTRVSGGYALTYDESNISIFTQPLDQYSLDTTFLPDGTVAAGPLKTIFTLGNQRLEMPRYRNWTGQFDRQFPAHVTLNANYLRRRGDHGFTYLSPYGAGLPPPPGYESILSLTNLRRDNYDSAQVSVHQTFGSQYDWMASYTRSRAQSNSVLPLSVDQTVTVSNNVGPVPWDAPNRVLGWFYLPTPWEKWAVAGLVEMRDGFPFSVQNENGGIVGTVNSYRYPMYFSLNVHLEYRFKFHGVRLALRGGFNNITSHKNYTAVINTIGAPGFLTYYGSDGRHFVLRFRWLGKE
jgi:hypothetical protein